MATWTKRTAPSRQVGRSPGSHVSIEFDKHFGDWHIDRGLLLTYIAEQLIGSINVRTDRGIDAGGSRFKPYPPISRGAWKFDPETNTWPHDERGRRIAYDIPDPRDVVTLRSLDEVQEGKRMRDWLRVSPAKLAPEARYVTIVQRGGRKSPVRKNGKGGENVSHYLRASTCVDTGRKHIGVMDAELRAVMLGITRDDVVAFIRRRSERMLAAETAKARARLQRQQRKTERAAKRAAATAEQRNALYRKRLDRMGIDASGNVKEQYKALARQKRVDKRERKQAR